MDRRPAEPRRPAPGRGARRGRPVVLVVGREGDATRALIAFLRGHDVDAVWARDGEGALNVLEKTRVDGVVTDLRAHRIDGMALLRRARERRPGVCGIVIAGRGEVDAAVEAMRQGADDFQLRPPNHGKILAVLAHGLERQAHRARLEELEARLGERPGLERMAARSRAMAAVMEQVRHVAPSRATVLVEGEDGTGKSEVAEAIHRLGARRDGVLVASSGALPGDLLEPELFGDERAHRAGLLEEADGGTVYLDAVDALPAPLQVKLLRVLQDRAFQRVGGSATLRTDIRLVAGTSRDLAAEVKAGRFREDLLYRLSAVRIQLPPLRERAEDIPFLVEDFIRHFDHLRGRRVTGITPGALERLMRHGWPGNVRELRNTVERMVASAEGRRPLDLSDLPEGLRRRGGAAERLELRVGMTAAEAERQLIAATLRHCADDKRKAAAMLGIGLRTLYRKLGADGGGRAEPAEGSRRRRR